MRGSEIWCRIQEGGGGEGVCVFLEKGCPEQEKYPEKKIDDAI